MTALLLAALLAAERPHLKASPQVGDAYMLCIEHDKARAEARYADLVRAGKCGPLTIKPSCVRCITYGRNFVEIEIEPLVCDGVMYPWTERP